MRSIKTKSSVFANAVYKYGSVDEAIFQLSEQLNNSYRKVVVAISADGSVTEERFVRCENCYRAVAEMFVSKAYHDEQITALKAALCKVKEAMNDVNGVLFGEQIGFDHEAWQQAVVTINKVLGEE